MLCRPQTHSEPIRLVIADVDGTLVTQEKILTERAIQSVFRLARRRHKICRHQRPPASRHGHAGRSAENRSASSRPSMAESSPSRTSTTIVRENFLPRAMVEKVITNYSRSQT